MALSREDDLYPHVEHFLHLGFAPRLKPSLGVHLTLVAITAMAGPAGSGKWSRPDLALINLWRHKYQPHQSLDLYGFEVKRDGGCDLASVHETLAHTRLVNFAYLVWHYSAADFVNPHFGTIKDNCRAYGLGLITFANPLDGSTYTFHIDAQRQAPDPSAVDEFIETRFAESQRQRLLSWIAEPRS